MSPSSALYTWMKSITFFLALCLIGLVFAGCSQNAPDPVEPIMPPASPTIELVLEDTAEPGITEAPIPTSNPAPVKSAPPLSRYTISAVLDYDAHKTAG